MSLLLCPVLCFIVQLLDIPDQVFGFTPILTVLPLPSIPHTPRLVIQPDGTARAHAQLLAPGDAVPQHPHAICAILPTRAVIQSFKLYAVLERTVFDQTRSRYLLVPSRQASCEAKVDLRIGVFGGSAELQDVAEALGLAVFAEDAIVVGGPARG